jgi:hypothetical protein
MVNTFELTAPSDSNTDAHVDISNFTALSETKSNSFFVTNPLLSFISNV